VEVELPPRFRKILKKKPADQQANILRCIKRLVENPRHPSLQTHPVRGSKGVFEAYVDMGNRVTFQYGDEGQIVMLNNCKHDILRRPR
jgi:mRNA-degrading endonuclease RelE of RelBE toxin-antitoxin system